MLTIWRFLDGNRAHEKQSAALLAGIRELLPEISVDCQNIDCASLSLWSAGRLMRKLKSLPPPQLLIGAGHRSHWPLLIAKRRFGGRTVVLMTPSLPLRWFDTALIPEHDRPKPLPNVLVTRGALTGPLPRSEVRSKRGLILIGGPSKHFHWDSAALLGSLRRLLGASLEWQVSDSRRTPQETVSLLRQAVANPGSDPGSGARHRLNPWQQCEAGWLERQLAEAEQVWVTRDSISMVFEALQSSARVGVIDVPTRRKNNKIHWAIQKLIDDGLVTDNLDDAGLARIEPRQPLDEYRRCAALLLCKYGLLPDSRERSPHLTERNSRCT